ncbi:MAG: hypothetical protein ACXU82_06115 [Caulobacteraceae bacterium]
MLFHLSIDADDPRHVAEVLAEIWDGRASPFPPGGPGAWVALAGDDRNTTVEILPRGTELVEAPGDADGLMVRGQAAAHSPTHMAVATGKTRDEILAIAAREGWPAKYRLRGGLFGVIELWVEGWRMVEVLTPEMQEDYRTRLPPWMRGAFAA